MREPGHGPGRFQEGKSALEDYRPFMLTEPAEVVQAVNDGGNGTPHWSE
jgi:hypothetical protein